MVFVNIIITITTFEMTGIVNDKEKSSSGRKSLSLLCFGNVIIRVMLKILLTTSKFSFKPVVKMIPITTRDKSFLGSSRNKVCPVY